MVSYPVGTLDNPITKISITLLKETPYLDWNHATSWNRPMHKTGIRYLDVTQPMKNPS